MALREEPFEVDEPRKRGRKKKDDEIKETSQVDTAFESWASQHALYTGSKRRFVENGKFRSGIIGVPFPALVLEYLYQSNVYPLGGTEIITGLPGCNKSSFMYEHYRWARALGGYSFHIENEAKETDELMQSTLNYDMHGCYPFTSPTMDGWMGLIIDFIAGTKTKSLKSLLEPLKLYGRIPLFMGVDSFTGTLSETSTNDIIEDGGVSRAYSWEAQAISRFLKAIPSKFHDLPIALMGVSHDKPSYSQTGARTDNIAGGYALRFQARFVVLADLVAHDRLVDRKYNRIAFKTLKNGMGDGKRTILADINWTNDPVTGLQTTWWDWDTATVKLLLGKDNRSARDGDYFGSVKSDLNAVMDITGLRDSTGGKCFSKVLGISADDAIPYAEMGALINGNEEFKKLLRPVMSIRQHNVFDTALTYSEQIGVNTRPEALSTESLEDIVEEVADRLAKDR